MPFDAKQRRITPTTALLAVVFLMVLACVPSCRNDTYSRASTANEPLDCLVLSLFPYRHDTDFDYFEKQERYIEKMTDISIAFRFVDEAEIGSLDNQIDGYRRVLIESLVTQDPPDIILDLWYRAVSHQDFRDRYYGSLHDVPALSAKHAPTICKYLRERDVRWNREKAVIAPMRNLVPILDVWLLRKDIWVEYREPRLSSFADMIEYLSVLKQAEVFEYPGAYIGKDFVDLVPLAYPEAFSSIAEVQNTGIYREIGTTKVQTIFGEYPIKVRTACELSRRALTEFLFTFDAADIADFDDRINSGEWAAAFLPLNLLRLIDFSILSREIDSGSITAIRVDQELLTRTFRYPSEIGMLFPENSDRAGDAMKFLEALNQPEILEAVYHGVPNIHYKRIGENGFMTVTDETRFKDYAANPFMFMSVMPKPILFDQQTPDSLQDLALNYYMSSIELIVDDPLEGFIFVPHPVLEAYDRYRTTHTRSYERPLRASPQEFDVAYDDFKASAATDYHAIQTEMQKQIDAFLLSNAGNELQ